MKQTEGSDVSIPIRHLKKTELLPTHLLFSNGPHGILSKAIISPAKSFLRATAFLSEKNTGEAKIKHITMKSHRMGTVEVILSTPAPPQNQGCS